MGKGLKQGDNYFMDNKFMIERSFEPQFTAHTLEPLYHAS